MHSLCWLHVGCSSSLISWYPVCLKKNQGWDGKGRVNPITEPRGSKMACQPKAAAAESESPLGLSRGFCCRVNRELLFAALTVIGCSDWQAVSLTTFNEENDLHVTSTSTFKEDRRWGSPKVIKARYEWPVENFNLLMEFWSASTGLEYLLYAR